MGTLPSVSGRRVGLGCTAAGGVVLTAMLTSCAGSPHVDGVSRAAVAFARAVEDKDGAQACRLLTPDARSSVTGATNVPCSKAILTVSENGASVTATQVWGDAAQVLLAGDVVFLRRMDKQWLVSAAGCKPRASGPYNCDVAG